MASDFDAIKINNNAVGSWLKIIHSDGTLFKNSLPKLRCSNIDLIK